MDKYFKNKNTQIVWQVSNPEDITRLMQNNEFEEVSEADINENTRIINQADAAKYGVEAQEDQSRYQDQAPTPATDNSENNFQNEFASEVAAFPESETEKKSSRKSKASQNLNTEE